MTGVPEPERSPDYLSRILTARVYDVAIESALDPAPLLSARLHARVLLKREDQQPVFSFKLRGAYNKMSGLSPETLARGVVAASAGNHAQGVALAAARLHCQATIVMPVTTPRIKVNAVAARGASVVLHGESYDDAYRHAATLSEASGATFIHPYDDPDIIAGQGTIAMEILLRHPQPITAVFVPVGGGGLLGGVAAYIKRVRPDIKVIGVEPVDAASMHAALEAGAPVRLKHVNLFADGVAVKQAGTETFRLAALYADEIVTVTTDEICAAIKDVFEDTRSVLEPAGALSVAGLKTFAARERCTPAHTLIAVTTGANMNFDRLRFVAERAEIGEHRETLFAATIPETPGSFKTFCRLLGPRLVTEFNYRYAGPPDAQVFVGLQVASLEEAASLFHSIESAGIRVLDLAGNELAKQHLRHLSGGRAPHVEHERLFRFEFPERPGALMRFLDQLSPNWNISLFHYRNNGADYGRVLAGIQVPPQDHEAFNQFLSALNFPYTEETQNPAARLFLA